MWWISIRKKDERRVCGMGDGERGGLIMLGGTGWMDGWMGCFMFGSRGWYTHTQTHTHIYIYIFVEAHFFH